MRSRLALLAVVLVTAAAVAGAGTAASWLFYSEAGLSWLSQRLVGFAGEGLALEGVAGTLAGGARVSAIRYVGDDIEVRAQDARLTLSPLSLLRLRPRLTGVEAREIAVVTKPGERRGSPPDSLELPVDFELKDAYVERLVVDLGKGPLDLTKVRLDYAGGNTRHTVRGLSLSAFGYAVALRGTIEPHAPFALKAAVDAVRSDDPQTTLSAKIEGNLTEMGIEGGGKSGSSRVSVVAALRPYDARPLVRVKARATALDLHEFIAALPRTAIALDLAIERQGEILSGPVRVTNAMPGPYDKARLPLASLRAVMSTDLAVVTFKSLDANLGSAGTVSGSGTIEGGTAVLTLTLRNLN